MRRVIGTILILAFLGILIHDAASGRMSAFRRLYDRQDLTDELYAAVVLGQIREVRIVLRKGVDVNAKRRSLGRAPLHWTTWYPVYSPPPGYTKISAPEVHAQIAELLIASGARVNVRDSRRRTPLDWATRSRAQAVAAVLRRHGGKTARELNIEAEHGPEGKKEDGAKD